MDAIVESVCMPTGCFVKLVEQWENATRAGLQLDIVNFLTNVLKLVEERNTYSGEEASVLMIKSYNKNSISLWLFSSTGQEHHFQLIIPPNSIPTQLVQAMKWMSVDTKEIKQLVKDVRQEVDQTKWREIVSWHMHTIILWTSEPLHPPPKQMTTSSTLDYLHNMVDMVGHRYKNLVSIIPPSGDGALKCVLQVNIGGKNYVSVITDQTLGGKLTEDLKKSVVSLRSYAHMMQFLPDVNDFIKDEVYATTFGMSPQEDTRSQQISKAALRETGMSAQTRSHITAILNNMAELCTLLKEEVNVKAPRQEQTKPKRKQKQKQLQAKTSKPQKTVQEDLLYIYADEIKDYTKDLEKPIHHKEISRYIQQARRAYIKPFLDDPDKSIKKESATNKKVIRAKRQDYRRQLLQKYGKQEQQTTIDPALHKKYKKEVQQHRLRQNTLRKKAADLLQTYHGNLDDMIDDYIYEHSGMIDNLSMDAGVITDPVYFPNTPKIFYEKKSVDQYLRDLRQKGKALIDPIARTPLDQRQPYRPAPRQVDQKFRSIRNRVAQIMQTSRDPIEIAKDVVRLRDTHA